MSEHALQLIAENKRTKNPVLDLGRCGLREIPKELFDCVWLEELILSNVWLDCQDEQIESANKGPDNYISEIPTGIENLQDLKVLKIGRFESVGSISDISSLKSLTCLQSLDLNNNKIFDFSFLQSLECLRSLALGKSDISDISFLKSLTSLQHLDLSENRISDFSFLKSLTSLQNLDLSHSYYSSDLIYLESLTNSSLSHISDFSFLQSLTNLNSLSLEGNVISDFSFLQSFPGLKSLHLGHTNIRDFSFLLPLTNLQNLDLNSNRVSDISFLQSMTNLQYLKLEWNRISNISFLKSLPNLQFLELGRNEISDISFLQSLTGLQYLGLGHNQISNFSSIQSLAKLESLDIRQSEISDYSFLQSLTSIKSLVLLGNQISDFSFLQSLTNLQSLDLRHCKISDISFLKSLTNLRSLGLGYNQISDISSLQSLTNLEYLDLEDNRISDIRFLEPLMGLQFLDLNRNHISDISFLRSMTGLHWLDISSNQISDITALIGPLLQRGNEALHVVLKDYRRRGFSWGEINIGGNPLTIPPEEIVWQGNDAVLYWFQAQDQGEIVNHEAKIILFGNGNSGKTSLSLKLRRNEFVPLAENDRTHGILIETWDIPLKDFPEKLRWKIDESIQQHDMTSPVSISSPDSLQIHLWDFGGQEYYHATHRLFMSSNILYLLLWETGTSRQDEEKGHYPVAYWQKSIRYFSPQNITLCIQNKVEKQADRTDDFHYKIEYWNENDQRSVIQYENDIKVLKEGILEHLTNLSYVGALFPKVYDDIRRALKNETKPVVSYTEYTKICDNTDFTSIKIMKDDGQKKTLIRFLDDTGAVVCFRFRKGIEMAELKEYVFISPNWLTQIIYEILERNRSEFDLQHVETIIAKQEYKLNARVWLGIMKQFELIFEIEKKDGIKYVVPQYLPLKCTNQEAFDWAIGDKKMQHAFTFNYPEFLPKSNFLRLIAKYGKHNIRYLYWKNGLFFSLNDKTIFAECTSNEEERKISICVQDNDAAATKEVFESLVAIDESDDLQVSINKKNYVSVKKLKEKYINNNIEIETTAGVTLPVATFNILFGKDQNESTKKSTMKNVFISYAHNDIQYRQELQQFLVNLERDKLIEIWQDGLIQAGEDWDKKIKEGMEKADICILLLSQSFIVSNYVHETEFRAVMEKRLRGNILIIPVLIKECDWKNWKVYPQKILDEMKKDEKDYKIASFQFLPLDTNKRVLPINKWKHQEDAWLQVAESIRSFVKI